MYTTMVTICTLAIVLAVFVSATKPSHEISDQLCECRCRAAHPTSKFEARKTTTALRSAKTTTPPPTCPLGWTQFKNSCYFYDATKKRWDEAMTACKSFENDASLVSISDEEELRFLHEMLQNREECVWTAGRTDASGYCIALKSAWKWSTNVETVAGNEIAASLWCSGEPSGSEFSYACIRNNQPCLENFRNVTVRPYVCKKTVV